MNNAFIWIAIFFVFGLILGLVIAWSYWRQRMRQRIETLEQKILGLQRSLVLMDQSKQSLQKRFEDKQTSISQLHDQVGELERNKHDLLTQSDKQALVMQPFWEI